MRHLAAPLLLALLFLLSSCDDDSRGLLITGDGELLSNTPARQRIRVIARIQKELDAQLGEHWRSAVALPELPTYDDDLNRGYPDNWFWAQATVQLELIGDGQQELPQPSQSFRDAVWDYLRRRVDRPKRNLSIEVTTHVDAARFAELTRAATAPGATAPQAASSTPAHGAAAAAPAASSANGARTYTVQTGDTLAIISSVFYGTPDRWRLITQANPGLDAAHLVPGAVIAIPPAPAP
jgi:nucleoid-associated protein YgaU